MLESILKQKQQWWDRAQVEANLLLLGTASAASLRNFLRQTFSTAETNELKKLAGLQIFVLRDKANFVLVTVDLFRTPSDEIPAPISEDSPTLWAAPPKLRR